MVVIKRLRLALTTVQTGPPVRLVVAVSGGRDSMALLYGLLQLRAENALSLVVATFDHGIRAASVQETNFVRAWCEQHHIPVVTGAADVPGLAADQHENLELAARRARYGFLAQVAHDHDRALIVTAHHADDQAETLLLHLLRGSGLDGLRGMTALSPHPFDPTLQVWRPLLSVARADITAFVQSHAIPYYEDATNADTTLRRNRVRHELLPALTETYNPQIVLALGRLAQQVQADTEVLRELVAEFIQTAVVRTASRWTLSHERFIALPVGLQRRLLVQAQLAFSELQAQYATIEATRLLLLLGDVRKQAVLGDAVSAYVLYQQGVKMIVIGRVSDTDGLLPVGFQPQLLAVDQPLVLSGATLILSRQPQPGATNFYVSPSATIIVRARKTGDRFQPRGLDGQHTRLAEWLVDRKVPRTSRDRLALICVDEDIAAIVLPDSVVITYSFTHASAVSDMLCIYLVPETPLV